MAKRASKMDRKLTKPDPPKRPRDRALPGLADGLIRELEQAAADYADVRDRRMELTQDEKQRKDTIMALMHKHRKTHYQRNGLEIMLEAGEETVKVKVKPPKEDDDEPEPREPEGDDEPEPEPDGVES